MSQVHCWECDQDYAKDEVFDIPVFSKGFTIVWCFNCAMKQLEWTDHNQNNIKYHRESLIGLTSGNPVQKEILKHFDIATKILIGEKK